MLFYDKIMLTAREMRIQKNLLIVFTLINILFSVIGTVTMQSALSADDILSKHIDIRYPDGEIVELKNAEYTQREDLLDIGFSDITISCNGDIRSIMKNNSNGNVIDKSETYIEYLPYHQLPELKFISGSPFDKKSENKPCILISEEISEKYGLKTGGEITFEGYTKKSIPFSVLGIYDKDDDTPDIIVNFAPYIKEIDLIGVYSGYGMYGKINKISNEVYIKEKCEKLGIYYTSCAENWFGSRRLMIILMWTVFLVVVILYIISQVYFETQIFENRKGFVQICKTLGMQKKHISRIFIRVCLLCIFAALILSIPVICFIGYLENISVHAVTGINVFSFDYSLILLAVMLAINTILTGALMRSRKYE